jgi:O-succinylbenzoate synthase
MKGVTINDELIGRLAQLQEQIEKAKTDGFSALAVIVVHSNGSFSLSTIFETAAAQLILAGIFDIQAEDLRAMVRQNLHANAIENARAIVEARSAVKQ